MVSSMSESDPFNTDQHSLGAKLDAGKNRAKLELLLRTEE
mgnify:CR=1 FL=1